MFFFGTIYRKALNGLTLILSCVSEHSFRSSELEIELLFVRTSHADNKGELTSDGQRVCCFYVDMQTSSSTKKNVYFTHRWCWCEVVRPFARVRWVEITTRKVARDPYLADPYVCTTFGSFYPFASNTFWGLTASRNSEDDFVRKGWRFESCLPFLSHWSGVRRWSSTWMCWVSSPIRPGRWCSRTLWCNLQNLCKKFRCYLVLYNDGMYSMLNCWFIFFFFIIICFWSAWNL